MLKKSKKNIQMSAAVWRNDTKFGSVTQLVPLGPTEP